jgi:hypothetical protein
MKTLLQSSFTWLFVGGFVIGAAGLAALHPSEAQAAPIHAVGK